MPLIFINEFLLELGPCQSNPCQNGATCFNGASSEYFCLCADGFEGVNCGTGKKIILKIMWNAPYIKCTDHCSYGSS